MKNKTRLVGLISLILLGALLLARPAMAGATFTEFTASDQPLGVPEGETWIEEGILYMRDMQYPTLFTQLTPEEELHISGILNATMNANIDLAIGCGHIWGKGENNDWRGSFQGKMCVDEFGSPTSFTTRGVLQGKGDLKGLQMRYDNVNGFMTGYVLETPSY